MTITPPPIAESTGLEILCNGVEPNTHEDSVPKRSVAILDYIENQGMAQYKLLAERFGVSVMTIRRECEQLVRKDLAIKTIGGIRRAHNGLALRTATASERFEANTLEKRAIAREAVRFIRDASTIFLDGSTTCFALAKLVDAEKEGLTIVTHSPVICLASEFRKNRIVCTGGELDPQQLCFVGPYAESFIHSIFIDVLFASATGIVPIDGAYDSSPGVSRIRREAAARSTSVVLLADHTKFGRRAFSKSFEISEIDHIITDSATDSKYLTELRNCSIAVSIAL